MTPTLITLTLAGTGYSLWIRRDTWRSPWEAGLTVSLTLQGCAVLLMAPGTGAVVGPVLHRIIGVANVQHLLGHLCLIVAAAALIYHGLTRLVDDPTLRRLIARNVVLPLNVGVPMLVAAFIAADVREHDDLFRAHPGTAWLGVYWLVLGMLLVHLLGYAGRVLAVLRRDARSRPAATAYLIGSVLGVAACSVQVSTAWAGVDASLPVWLCLCLGVLSFAYGSARSWLTRIQWFVPQPQPRQPVPPQITG